jgi:hypothetical protein
MADNSAAKVFRSKMFTSKPVRAVFPDLNKPDKYGSYKVGVDVLNDPEFKALLEQQAAQTVAEGQVKLETKKKPTNDFFKPGEYKEQPFERVFFKMKEETTRKGKKVKQKPRMVDAKKNPMDDVVFGGSLVRIAYFFQYTVTPTGVYISPKLNAVQVLEHVGPGGEASIDSMFDEEQGYVSAGISEATGATGSDEDGADEGSDDARDF